MKHQDALRLTPDAMKANIPGPNGERFHIGLQRGQLTAELYVPQIRDTQKPHNQDECYIVIRGDGNFQMGQRTIPFKAGDFLFVPAGMPHRFLDFGHDLEAWVIFYGPQGGDDPSS